MNMILKVRYSEKSIQNKQFKLLPILYTAIIRTYFWYEISYHPCVPALSSIYNQIIDVIYLKGHWGNVHRGTPRLISG